MLGPLGRATLEGQVDWSMDWIALAWVLVGIVLIVIEVMTTGFVAVFFGIAAIVTGLAITAGLPEDGPWPWVLFSVLSVGLLVLLRRRFSDWFRGSVLGEGGPPGADEDYIGREAIVLSGFGPQDHGRGQVEYRGAGWAACCDTELEPGARVTITAMNHLTLTVSAQEN